MRYLHSRYIPRFPVNPVARLVRFSLRSEQPAVDGVVEAAPDFRGDFQGDFRERCGRGSKVVSMHRQHFRGVSFVPRFLSIGFGRKPGLGSSLEDAKDMRANN